jgi:hypothetical protein
VSALHKDRLQPGRAFLDACYSEIGTDMMRFPTAGLVGGLVPRLDESAGVKVRPA